jgi:hypothetical protein
LWGWLRSAAVAGVLTAALYAPFFRSARHYWAGPETPSVTYGEFLDHSLRHAQTGWEAAGAANVLLPLVVLLAGGWFAWRRGLLREQVMALGAAGAAGALIPALVPLAGETRAMLWLAPLYCIGATALVTTPLPWPHFRWFGKVAAYTLLLLFCVRIHFIATTPAQPIRDAIVLSRQEWPGRRLVGLYMASREAEGVYGDVREHRGLDGSVYTLEGLAALHRSGTPHTVLVFYEGFLESRRPELWAYLRENYELVRRLPGRISPSSIYQPRGRR